MVYTGATMALPKRAYTKPRPKHVRRSVTLTPKIARQVDTLARQRDLSDNRVWWNSSSRVSKLNGKRKKHSSSWPNASAPPAIRSR